MSLYEIRIFAMFSCSVYSVIMLHYSASLCGFRNKNYPFIAYPLVVAFSTSYTKFTLFYIPIPLIYSMAFLIIAIMFHLLLKGTWLQHIFAAGNFIFHIISMRGLTLTVFSLMYSKSLYWITKNEGLHDLSLGLSFFILILYLITFTYKLYPTQKILILIENAGYLKLMAMIQLILNSLFIMGSVIYYNPEIPIWFSAYHLSAFLVIIITFYILFHFCIQSCVLQKIESACRIYEEQLKKQVDAYMAQLEYIHRIRKFKYDCISMQNSVMPTLGKKENKEFSSFFKELEEFLQEISLSYKEFSSHPQIQALLHHTYTMCQEKGIDFNATAVLPEELPLSDFDLRRIFTGITSTALAVTEQKENLKDKYIHISTAISDNWCTIVCEYSFFGDIHTQKQLAWQKNTASQKEISIRAMEEILESCGGFIKTKADTQNHTFKVFLHLPIVT